MMQYNLIFLLLLPRNNNINNTLHKRYGKLHPQTTLFPADGCRLSTLSIRINLAKSQSVLCHPLNLARQNTP